MSTGLTGKSKLDDKQQLDLLKIYYNQKHLCDHLWIEGDMIYQNEFEYKLTDLYENLNEYSQNDKPALIIHINSMGGQSYAGEMLYNLIRKFPKPTIGVVEGECMSAATYVFMACDLRIFKPYVRFLIHQTNLEMGRLKFKQLRRESHELQLSYQNRVEIYSKRSKMPIQVIKDYLRAEKFMSTNEALKYQVIHHIFNPKKIKKSKVKNGKTKEMMMSTFQDVIKILAANYDFFNLRQVNKLIVYSTFHHLPYIESLKYINLMLEIPVPIDFVITSTISNGQILMSLFANKTYILKSMSMVILNPDINLQQGEDYNSSIEDNVQRTKHGRNLIGSIFKQKTKLPKHILDDVFFKLFSFKPEEALKYGLVDEVIDLDPEIKEMKEKQEKETKKMKQRK